MRWKLISVLIVILLLAPLALAGSDVEVTPIKNSITLTETALFELSITNYAEEKQRYSIFSFVQGWDIEPLPLKDKIIEVYPLQTKTTTIKVKPTEAFGPGLYNLALNVESDMGEKYAEILPVYLNPDKPLGYLPAIKVVIGMNERMDPREPQSIRVLLQNKNPLDLTDLVIKLQSDLAEFNKETSVHLPSLDKKNIEFVITPDPYQKPGKYFLFFSLEKGGDSIKVVPREIEILALTPPFEMDVVQDKAFLKTTNNLLIKNIGNVENTQGVKFPVSLWENIFIQSTAKTIKEDGQRYLSWELTLAPEETTTVLAVKNYRYPFYILFIVLAALLVYLYFRSPISLVKKVTQAKQDATLSELKITLDLKSLIKKPLKNVEVIDLVPGIADIEKSLQLGTLKPHEVKHTRKGTLVKWKLGEIDPKEHRVITYKIKSKLRIIGALKLPRAKARFGAKKKKKIAYSNACKISS
ncbi:hypothetical protein GOV03_05105 [Candidatus Woesearchaeota archaeon]|nr:hypothetical protein [Candidatus Woesearchaeota archaeon]